MGKLALFGLCAFVAFMPFEMMFYFEQLPSGAKMAGIGCVLAALLSLLAGHPLRLLSRPMAMRVVLATVSAISLAWSSAPVLTMQEVVRTGQLLVFVLILWEFAVTYKDHLWILRSLLAGMLVPLSMAAAEFHGASRFAADEGMRYGGGGQDLNYLAYMYTVSLLVAVYLATNSLTLDRYLRWIYWGVAATCALGTILTGSRGGFACLITASIFTMVLAGLSRRRVITIVQILGLALVIYFLVWSILPSTLLERATLGGGAGTSLAEDPRIRIWMQGLASLRQNPLLGVGAGAYVTVTGTAGGKAYVAHNTFISVAVELGLVGLALYLAYIYMLFRAAWRLPQRERMLWTGCMAIWFLAAISAGSQIDKFTWFLHTMILVQSAAYIQSRPARNAAAHPVRPMPVARGPLPPRAGHA